jgi:hypothetical protein
MTPKFLSDPDAFIKKIHGLYLARKEEKEIAPGVYRGTNPSVSSKVENLFGRYVKAFLPDSCFEIWVDPQISCPQNPRGSKTRIFRPDICVIREDTVVAIFELKMDLGYIREKFTGYAEERAAILRELAGAKIQCSIGRQQRKLRFTRGLRPNFVVFCEANISAEKMGTIKAYFGAKNAPGKLFILSSRDHLNDDGANYEVNEDAFDELEKTIKAIGKPVRVSGRK